MLGRGKHEGLHGDGSSVQIAIRVSESILMEVNIIPHQSNN